MAEENRIDHRPLTPMAATVAAGGLGGAVIMAVLKDYPGVIQQLMNWGPAILIFALVGWFGRPAVQAQVNMSRAVDKLSFAIQERFRQEDDVRMAVRVLAAKMDEHGQKLDQMMEEVRKR